MSPEITRRRALQLLGAGAAAVVVAGVGSLRRRDGDGDGAASTTATAPLPDDPVARIGRRYLDEVPEEEDADRLRELLGVTGSASAALNPTLLPAVAADFTAGDIVVVDGWHLSRTEARAAALFALESAN
jgi:hypothetical protein